jgi:DNA-directed RNA polymerase subunit RPC12/RpoP
MIGKQGKCSECGYEGWLPKPSLMLCHKCNQKRLSKNRVPKEPTGEKVMFEMIWNEREHKSFLTEQSLEGYFGHESWFALFAHVLSKAQNKYPKFKLYKKNIVLLTPFEHHLLDHGTEKQREDYAKEYNCDWNKIYKLKEELKNEYKAYRG